jgi:hypothetical protein
LIPGLTGSTYGDGKAPALIFGEYHFTSGAAGPLGRCMQVTEELETKWFKFVVRPRWGGAG